MSKISATIVADSLSPQGDRLTSVLVTFPRIILSEINTHRMLSKNTSSSRAIPFHKMVEAVKNNPFIPIAWQKDHKGMQGSEYAQYPDTEDFKVIWLEARDNAIKSAQLAQTGSVKLTKQLCNRLLEPFMWTTMLITGSKEGWQNFFKLRCPDYEVFTLSGLYNVKSCKEARELALYPDEFKTFEIALQHNKGQAEIHLMDLAEKIYDAVNESTPRQLKAGEWHIPMRNKIDNDILLDTLEDGNFVNDKIENYLVKISTAMAARTSYTVVGDEKEVDYFKMIELHDKLIAYDPPHSSPMEHCARAMSNEEFVSFTKSIHSISNKVEKTNQGGLRQGEVMVDDFIVNREEHYGWCNNLKGFIPYRYMIDNKIEL